MINKDDKFGEIKKYLARLRVWDVNVIANPENVLCFELENKWTMKYYYIATKPKDWKSEYNPYLYYVNYEQKNVGVRHDTLADIVDNKSFGCEEYVIRYIRKSLQWHPKG